MLVTLMDFMNSANWEGLIRWLQEILKAQIVQLTLFYMTLFGAEESEAVNMHFEATGYEPANFQINAGPTLLYIFLAPLY